MSSANNVLSAFNTFGKIRMGFGGVLAALLCVAALAAAAYYGFFRRGDLVETTDQHGRPGEPVAASSLAWLSLALAGICALVAYFNLKIIRSSNPYAKAYRSLAGGNALARMMF